MEIILTFLIIAACFAGLGIGFIISGKKLKGSCGGFAAKGLGPDVECSVCGKKGDEIDACDTPEDKPREDAHKEENPSSKPHSK